jgi:regulator of nucleoside diphosphate kinase
VKLSNGLSIEATLQRSIRTLSREGEGLRGDAKAMNTRRRILITEDDMAQLRELVHQGRIASRRDQVHLEELDRELDRAEVVTANDVSPDVVTMHSTVQVHDLDDESSVAYTLVFPEDADIDRKRISVLAPIGTALIGYRVGDLIEWATPGRTRRLQIDDVLFQPEASSRREHLAELQR